MTAEEIKKLREKFGLTQGGLAKKIGASRVSVNNWENGKTRPNNMAKRSLAQLDGAA